MGKLFSRIARAFDDGDDGPGGWWIAVEPELHLGPNILVPDVCGWRRERVPAYSVAAAWDIAPDWICEVVSPSTGRYDRMRKLPVYARHEVQHAWLVDPVERMIEVFRLASANWIFVGVYGGDEPARIEPFDAIEFPIATLWLPENPPA